MSLEEVLYIHLLKTYLTYSIVSFKQSLGGTAESKVQGSLVFVAIATALVLVISLVLFLRKRGTKKESVKIAGKLSNY